MSDQDTQQQKMDRLRAELLAAQSENQRLREERDAWKKTEHGIRVSVQAGDRDLETEVSRSVHHGFDLQREVFALEKERDALASQVATLESANNHMALARTEAACPDDETLVIHCRELRAQVATLTAERDAFQLELQKVCDHDWQHIDDSFDHEFGTEQLHSCLCEKCGATKPYEPETFGDEAI